MDSSYQEPEPVTAGWQAIDAALKPIYGDQQPRHYGTLLRFSLGGPDPLDGISAYPRTDPVAHWHLVTYGFSELYEKQSQDPEESGYGFELTLRLRRDPADTAPPNWVLNFLQNLARYVFQTGNGFAEGDHMDLNGPMALESDTALTAAAFMLDPELGGIATPNGRLAFLQVVGLTREEYVALLTWDPRRFHDALQRYLPLGLTDLGRSSLLEVASFAHTVQEGIRREGSSTGCLFVDAAQFRVHNPLFGQPSAEVTLGAHFISMFAAVLPARLGHGRDLALACGKTAIVFKQGDCLRWSRQDDDTLTIELTLAAARELASQLAPRAGSLSVPGLRGLTFRIVASPIRDSQGRVVRTVG